MNRIYKIVWSKAKNTYVVASELAKSHTKSASGKAVKTAMAAVVGMGLLMGGYVGISAAPATNPPGEGPGVAIGTGSSSNDANSVAVGSSAKTTGAKAVAVGNGARAQEEESTAIGFNTNVTKKYGTTVGNRSSVQAEGGSAFGYNAQIHADGKNGVAVGSSSFVRREGGTAVGFSARSIGTNAVAVGNGAVADSTSTVAVGDGANVASNVDLVGGIAIGKKAYVLNGGGRQEAELGLDRSNWPASISGAYNNPVDKTRVATGIAIGTNAYARTGSVQLGAHTYVGTMGGTQVNASTNGEGTVVNMTTVGSNSYNKAIFGTMVGAYSIATGDFDGNSSYYAGQNFGSSVVGSLNSIRTKGHGLYSGIANSIVGLANMTENTNGSLIFGAGNNITNSIKTISGLTSGAADADAMSAKLRKAIQDNESGGAMMAIGGGNTADYAQASQIIGVNNTLRGTNASISKYNLLNGYKNTAAHVRHVSVIGTDNSLSGSAANPLEDVVLVGNNRSVGERGDHSVVLGSADTRTYNTTPNVVTIGHNANVQDHGGNTSGGGDVAIGHSSFIENYINQSGSIALGQKAHVQNMTGTSESGFTLGQTTYSPDASGVKVPDDPSKVAEGVAIGENSYARTGSLMVGTHKYIGDMGDTTVDTSDAGKMADANQQINATTLGTNSFSNGAFSTVTGAYSIISGDYSAGKWRNFGASVTGSLNSIESKTASAADAGVATNVMGTANRTYNTNGALVLGAGNEVTNSLSAITTPTSNTTSAKDLADKLRAAVKDGKGGGAVVAVGNANTADYVQNSQIVGSNNTVRGTANVVSSGNALVGSNRKLTNVSHNAVLGSADNEMETAVSDATIFGHNANVTVAGGVALGADSIASVDKGVEGYDPSTQLASTDTSATWKATAAAVSVGDSTKNIKITRQITNVAAGSEDTDAVNVAQLKQVKAAADAARTHFYSVNSTDSTKGNYNNNGATGTDALAAGVGASAMSHNSVAIGTNAKTQDSNGGRGSGDVAVGNEAQINNYADQGGSIAIGQNAKVENMAGQQEAIFAFGQTTYSGSWFSNARIPADPSKVAGGIAIGENTFARTGSLMVGTHNYKGKLGDMEIDSANTRATGINVNATTLGTNSYNLGAFSTVTGAYSIASGNYAGGRDTYDANKNFGATIMGSLNSIESATASSRYSGIANSIVGTANRTFNSNGSLIFGAGNEITNSITSITAPSDGGSSAKELSDKLRTAVKNSNSGGATLAVGGGNTADYTQASQIIGVNNTLKGSSGKVSKYNMLDGYKNIGTNINHVSVIGSENEVENTDDALVLGNKRKLSGANGSIILSSGKNTITTAVKNAVAIGSEANVEKEGGVALGADSVAAIDKGVTGYDPSTKLASTDTSATWKATAAAVSVGKAATPTSAAVTRQITNVAAGTQDTDAVNVAQLKKVQAAAGAAKVHYYSAKSTKTGAGSNYDNDGAEAEDSIVLGISSSSKGVNSTVLGNNNKLTGVKNGRNNSIVAGQNLDVEGVHNAVFGTDYNNYDHKLTKVFGEQNTVIGVGNLVGYTAEKDPSDPTKWIYTKNSSGSDQNVAVGMKNTVNGASVVVGADSEAEGIGASFGRGNKVIGPDNGGGYRGLALGNNLTVKGEEAVAVGTDASATADWAITMGTKSSAEKETSMAFGYDSHAKVVGGVALGAWSVADRAGGVSGYDSSTKAASTDTSATWKATAAAVSVGDSTGNTKITRQITNVAAGSEDTDAVNVAQLKKVEAKAAEAEKKHTTVKAGDYVTVTEDTNGDGGKEYTISGPKMESTDGTVKITDKVENGKKVGYNLSVNTSSLGIEKTEVTAGENVTVTSKKDGNKTTYTINAKDTVVTGGTASYAADGKGTATLTNNDGSTATITGLRDLYTSSAALDGNTLNFTRNDGNTYSVSGIASTKDIWNITNKVDKLGTRVNKVGAGAAALAALHPLDFDPDDKWDIAAGYGNYKDAHAVAVGAFYRPNEDLMFSVGGSFGGGENMVNAGVSLKLGQGNHVSTSKVAMAKEIVDLRDENKDLKKRLDTMEQKMNSILGILDMGKKKDFPDVPENHWAYEYVATLAGNGIIEGYPDGMFSGDRSMTRYEFAAMFYRALKNGAPVDDNMDRAMNEFEPELRQIRLDRIRVDRISGKDNDRNKVERVRVNSEDNKAKNDYRDVYGSHISPKA